MNILDFKIGWAKYKDIESPSSEFFLEDENVLLFLNYIDDSLRRELINTYPENFLEEYTISMQEGVYSYALPSDFESMRCGQVVELSSNKIVKEWLRKSYGSSEDGFYISGSNIVFTGNVSNTTITLRYIPTRTQYTSDSDTLILSDTGENKKFYYDAFSQLFNDRERDWDDASVSQQLQESIKDIILKNYNPTEYLEIDDFSNVY